MVSTTTSTSWVARGLPWYVLAIDPVTMYQPIPIGEPSWGGMLSRDGRTHMEVAPWLALWPGLCLTVVVYVPNMFGDAMRDLLDRG